MLLNNRFPFEFAPCVENSPSILEYHETMTSLGVSSLSEIVSWNENGSSACTTSPSSGLVMVRIGGVPTEMVTVSVHTASNSSFTSNWMLCVVLERAPVENVT